ncbi:MAG: GNAT family N-acetyltransferase [Acidimicrobiales bacterium]
MDPVSDPAPSGPAEPAPSERRAPSGRPLVVRPLADRDLSAAVPLHRQVLDVEFLTRFGPGFLRRYYQAWAASPGGIALVATDGLNVVGVLLGATDPSGHARAMVRGHGMGLAVRMAAAAAARPSLAYELAVTRSRRYARGLWRSLRRRPSTSAGADADCGAAPQGADFGAAPQGTETTPGYRSGGTMSGGTAPGDTVGEITHLLVDPAAQGGGIGRALVDAAVAECRAAGVSEVELVTPPDFAARRFYERLGWVPVQDVVSQSGERFVKYRFAVEDASGDDRRER